MKLIQLLICIVFTFPLVAQYQINGNATQLDCNCYELTPDQASQAGSVWNQNLISLDDPFDFKFTVFLGCDDAGADGIAFAFQPVGTGVGSVGSSMGLAGISPVLSVVIDTYQNPYDTDPNEDHIGINTNGNLAHDGGVDDLAGPGLLPNMEDCQWHDFRVTWDPLTQTLNAYVDGVLISTYTGDIINNVFGGDPQVYWGLTSATGGAWNNHKFCTELLASFTPTFTKTCVGQDVVFISDVNAFSPLAGLSWDFGDGNSSSDAEPTHSYTANGVYDVILTATDQSGCSQKDTVQVEIGNFVSDLITPSSSVCPSETVDLEVQLNEADFPPCEYTLELGAAPGFFNWWTFFAQSYVHVYIDGVLFDSYTMNSGNPSSFTFDVPYGANVQLIFDDGGGNDEDELSVSLYDYSNNQLFSQDDLSGMNGTSLFDFTSTCGFTPDYTFSWSPAASLDDASSLTPTATISQETTYYFDIIDNTTGCQFTDSVTIDIDMNSLLVDATVDNSVICAGEQVQLGADVTDNSATGNGTFTFLWEPASTVSNEAIQNPTSNPVAETTYIVTVTENGSTCFAIDSVTVTTTGDDPEEVDLALCQNSNYTFPDGTSQQITGDFDQTSVIPTTSGCDSVIISHVTMTLANVTNQAVTICSGGGIIYADGTTSSNLQADESHTSVFSDINGCDSLVVTSVTVTPPITHTENVQLCSGSDFTYPDGTVSNNIVSNVSQSSTVISFSGCDSIVTTNVSIVSTIQVSVEDTLCPGESYVFPDGSVISSASSDELNVSNFMSVNGCDSVVTTQVYVVDTDDCSPDLPFVIAPNVITPNNDGDNDFFFLKTENIESIEIVIINRWGDVMYDAVIDGTTLASGLEYGWDGSTLKGVECSQGTYFYTYSATPINGDVISGHGFIELIRN